VLRLASGADVEEIAELFSTSFRLLDFLPPLHTRDEDRAYVRDVLIAEQRVTVAEAGGEIVGFLAESPGWINQLYVRADRLHEGIGSLLMADAKARAASLELWCFAENHAARRFYERHGFVEVERTDGRGNEAGRPDIRYRWERPETIRTAAILRRPAGQSRPSRDP
jgi:GNAT superfamily N-acetyltransferase